MVRSKKNLPFWSRPAFALILLPLLSLLFNWPYINAGLSLDDVLLYNGFQEDPLPFAWWEGAWSRLETPSFDMLWWKDPDFGGTFWRPIPSLIYQASYHLFDKNAAPFHLLSILVHGAVSALLYLLVRKLTDTHWTAFLAGLLFVACEDHSMTVGWLATSTDLFCVLFILLALLSHISWLKRRKPGYLAGSLLALIFAMGCKETAAIAPVAIVLLSFFMPNGTDAEDFDWTKLRQRAASVFRDPLSWLPAVLVLAAYIGFYKSLQLGVMNNLLYIDPIDQPGRYFANMVLQLPIMWLAAFSTVPIFFGLFYTQLLQPFAAAGLAIFVAWIVSLRSFRNRPLILWSLSIFIITLLPQVCTDASERGLYFPMIPATILIAGVVSSVGPLARRIYTSPPVTILWTRIVGWIAIVAILIPGILLSALYPISTSASFSQPEKAMRTAIPHLGESPDEQVVLLNGYSFFIALYTRDYLLYLTGNQYDVHLLSAADGVFSLEKTGDNEFVIRTDRAGWLSNFVARVMRTEPELIPGRRYEMDLFTATLDEMTEDGKDVLAVRFEFKQPLDDPELLFLKWNGEAYEPLDISAMDIGETVLLADSSAPFGFKTKTDPQN